MAPVSHSEERGVAGGVADECRASLSGSVAADEHGASGRPSARLCTWTEGQSSTCSIGRAMTRILGYAFLA